MAAFEEASGLKINAYNGPTIGEAIRGLLALSRERHTLQRSRTLLSDAVTAADQVLEVSADLLAFLQRAEPQQRL